MSVWLLLALASFALALLPAIVFAGNLREFRRLPCRGELPLEPVSVLIPARDEAASIEAAMASVLANTGVPLELIVLDDHSTDDTAAIVTAIAQRDNRVRLIAAPPLPQGWCGKQHACQILAEHAKYQSLLWMDADVRLAADAVERMAGELARNSASLISGFPLQRTETWMERLLIPLMHFILLGFLPIRRMRSSLSPSLGAGCGQLFMARREAYFQAGGHAAIRASLHDGIALPRAFRRAGKATDIFDASDLAECRMYDSAPAVWNGLLKNAGEGIATPKGIVPWTLMLFGGQVLPLILVVALLMKQPRQCLAIVFAATACGMGIAVRAVSVNRFYLGAAGPLSRNRQEMAVSARMHSLGVLVFLLIQWHSIIRRITGRRSTWRGRSY